MATNGTNENVGKLIEIKGVVIDAVFPSRLPEIYSALRITRPDGGDLIAEVQQHLGDDRVRAVAMDSTDGLARGTDVVDTGAPISVPVGDVTLGRLWNVLGDPIDEQGRAAGGASAGRSTATRPTFAGPLAEGRDLRDRHQGRRPDRAVRARRQDRPLRRRRRRQDGADPGADRQHRPRARRRLGLLGRRRAHARGQRPPARDDRVRACIDKVALCFGQMNEPPGARLRVGLSGLTMAEYFRDQGQDVLLFIDNIFRFVQAGSEVSALLGRMPSAVGYQPTLATEMGQLQERITSTNKGSVTSVQAIYVPADDLTDPAPANTFAHLDSTTVLSRAIVEQGIYPAVDPLDSTSRALAPRHRLRRALRHRDARAGDPPALQGPAGHHRHPRDRGALGRGPADGRRAPARSSASSRSRSSSPRCSPARRASTCKLEDTIRGFAEIIEGQHDELPEQAFYMVGPIEGAVERGKQLAAA